MGGDVLVLLLPSPVLFAHPPLSCTLNPCTPPCTAGAGVQHAPSKLTHPCPLAREWSWPGRSIRKGMIPRMFPYPSLLAAHLALQDHLTLPIVADELRTEHRLGNRARSLGKPGKREPKRRLPLQLDLGRENYWR